MADNEDYAELIDSGDTENELINVEVGEDAHWHAVLPRSLIASEKCFEMRSSLEPNNKTGRPEEVERQNLFVLLVLGSYSLMYGVSSVFRRYQ